MMTISTDKIAHLTTLAQLEISPDEVDAVARKIDHILEMIEPVTQANTHHIKPLSHPLDTQQPLRADKITETDQHARYQKIAPSTENGLYIVPQFIETE